MHQEVIHADAIAQRNNFRIQPVQPDALVAIFPEDKRLTMFKVMSILGFDRLVGGVFKDGIIEDFAVLIDLDKSRPLMSRGALQDFREMMNVDIDGAGDKGRLSANGDRQG